MKCFPSWVLTASAVVLWAAIVQAALCPKCNELMYTTDIGKCTVCGGDTSSGAFKLCAKCSSAKHQCQHCLTALAEAPATKASEKPAAEPATKLTDADDGKTFKVKVGDVVAISLKGNPTTGYSWRTAKLDGKAVEQAGQPKYTTNPHRPGMVGVGGKFVFRFNAAKSGKTQVHLEYVRPWEKNIKPVQTFTATIEVEEKSR